ncbi:MAG: FtsX-like permease family protein [Acidobacteria bacterium]|nr:FtsX-like permease family protein [Acidobacteriota bacterium]
MMFVLRMAARELRASWRRLLFFFICVAIGVGAIVALRSVIQSVRGGLTSEARSIIGADVLVQTNRAWTPQLRASLQQRFDAAPVLSRMDSVETATMVRAESGTDAARIVELRGVEEGFPYYGTFVLEGGSPYSHDLLRGGGALVRPELLTQLGIARGDRIIIGGRPFTVRGVILQEPGRRVGAFSFGSRVLVDYWDLQRTGLLTFGSRASYQILLRVRDDGVEALVRTLRRDFRDQFVMARSYRSTEDQIGEDLQRAENYLSLVGFIIVVLGGIGVWSVTRVFVRQKIRSVAILKCVGASSKQVLATYVLQVMLLGLTGSLLGVGLAAGALRALPPSISAALGGLDYGVTPSAVVQGIAVGVLVSLLFSLVPLLDVRRIKPLLLLRGGDTMPVPLGPRADAGTTIREGDRRSVMRRAGGWLRGRVASADWLQIGAGVLVTAALVGVAAWQAASLRAGAIVCLGFAGIAIVLHVAGATLVRAVAPLAAAPWFPLRHAVVSLRRPGNQTRVILLAVGLGSFFVLGVRALQTNLLAEFSLDVGRAGADLFLIDIQQDQVDGVRAFLRERAPEGSAKLVPVLRARVTGVRGREVNLESYSDVRGRGSLAREYVITYRNTLEPNEKILSGTFWTNQPPLPASATELEVSIERRIHDRDRVNLGDRMRFDVLGRIVEARVTSVREVDWEDSRNGGFMFVFRPGPLSQAPHTFIGFLRGPGEPAARARFQRDLVAAYPNLSAIDIREVLASVNKVVETVTLAISIVGGVALTSGILILIGAVAMTKFQRVYEAAILRTLGAGTRLLAGMLALEYSALGLLAGLIGAGGALALSWAVCRYVFEIDWRPAPVLLTVGAILTTLLVAAIGVLASADVLRRKPLATLRAE